MTLLMLVKPMLDFINDANIGERQIIDLSKDKIISKGHRLDKTLVKYVERNTTDIITGYESELPMVLPFTDLKKFIEILKIFDNDGIESVTVDITATEESDRLVATSMKCKGKRKTATITFGEVTMIQYLPTNIWLKLCDITNPLYQHKLSADDVTSLKKLLRFETVTTAIKDVKRFMIVCESIILYKSIADKWELEHEPVIFNGSNITFELQTSILQQLQAVDHTITIIQNPINQMYCLIAQVDGSNTTYMVALEQYDKNRKR